MTAHEEQSQVEVMELHSMMTELLKTNAEAKMDRERLQEQVNLLVTHLVRDA